MAVSPAPGLGTPLFLISSRKSLGVVKPHLLDFNLIAGFTFMGIPGMLMAFSLALKPFYIILTFQLLVLEFGFISSLSVVLMK